MLALGSAFFLRVTGIFRKDGDLNYACSKTGQQQVSSMLEEMAASSDVSKLPAYLTGGFPDAQLILQGEKTLFKTTWKLFVKALQTKWGDMIDLHSSLLVNATKEALQATPCTNDFLEGYFGYVATLGSRLGPGVHPQRLVSLATFGYNRRTLLLLKISTGCGRH